MLFSRKIRLGSPRSPLNTQPLRVLLRNFRKRRQSPRLKDNSSAPSVKLQKTRSQHTTPSSTAKLHPTRLQAPKLRLNSRHTTTRQRLRTTRPRRHTRRLMRLTRERWRLISNRLRKQRKHIGRQLTSITRTSLNTTPISLPAKKQCHLLSLIRT